jgi:hypothetical protein
MPLVSAQSYVKGLLQGLTPPGDTGIKAPVDALVTPLDPDVNPDGVARVYVWPARGPEKRRAMPRNTGPGTPAGWKQLTHELEIFLVWMDSPDDPGADINFPLLIDFVMGVLRTSPNPSQYTDPDTGVTSNMVNLGEDMSYDYVPPRTLEPQALRRYDARIRCSLLELFQS